MAAAAVSIALMIAVLFKYGCDNHAPPPTTKPASSQPHVGAQHHTAATDEGKHMGGELAPLQVFATAKVGDWAAYRIINRSSLLPEEIVATKLAVITAATDATVTIEHKGRVDKDQHKRESWTQERPRQGLTIDQLTGNDVSKWQLIDVKTSDDPHAVGGRTFKSKQIAYAAIDPLFPTKKVRVTYWYSDEFPLGLVEERDIQDLDAVHIEQLTELIGFGTASATTWGTKPDGL
jgi:hypothetical protein